MPDRLLRDEAARQAALAEYDILDTAPETPFERMVVMVRMLLDVPMATISFIDKDRQWFKARRGIEDSQTERKVAICDYTVRSPNPLVIPDLRKDPRFCDLPSVRGDPPLLAYLGIPLITPSGHALGALCAMDHVPRDFAPRDVMMLQQFAALVIDWLEMRRISRVDFLTGAMTRRAFREELEREMARHLRHGRPAAIVMLDIDHFKRINDTHGHEAGDKVLKTLAEVLGEELREGDLLARLGGEEFAILLPETEPSEACAAAERLRAVIEERMAESVDGNAITASFGVASLAGTCASPEAWLVCADRALYKAKASGRNCCVTA